MTRKTIFSGVVRMAKDCSDSLKKFEEGDTAVLPPGPTHGCVTFYDLIALVWGTMGLISFGLALSTLR